MKVALGDAVSGHRRVRTVMEKMSLESVACNVLASLPAESHHHDTQDSLKRRVREMERLSFGVAASVLAVGADESMMIMQQVSMMPSGIAWVNKALACVGIPPVMTDPSGDDHMTSINGQQDEEKNAHVLSVARACLVGHMSRADGLRNDPFDGNFHSPTNELIEACTGLGLGLPTFHFDLSHEFMNDHLSTSPRTLFQCTCETEIIVAAGDLRISKVVSGDPVIVGSIFVHERE